MNWIKVEDQLPEQDVWVVAMQIIDGFPEPFIAYRDYTGWYSKEGQHLTHVKAWFELPEFNE